ncbi:MAG TPA: DUF4846 domain-containing protein [Chitinophagaceae bacterium]|nr:DUF4846 domain-containing protein [Chitinophagaceae bacterium]
MLKSSFLLLLGIAISCGSIQENTPAVPESISTFMSNTVAAIPVPAGYTRVPAVAGSFAAWLRTLPLKKDKTVYLYNGSLKRNQSAQFAVLDISVGTKDLQQCADAVMRLRAEYLFAEKKYTDIAFMDYSGKWYNWSGEANRSRFDNYLQTVFGYCGSASLEKQMKPVTDFNNVNAGDVLVKGGFPGHAMTVVDVAVNKKGNKIYMLAQGYQPAQDIHIVINPMNDKLSPWYEVSDATKIITPEWKFYRTQLKKW